MIKKHSSQTGFSDQVVSTMTESLKEVDSKFSFAELTSTLVKCADALDEAGDKLADDVDSVLVFIEKEFIQ